MDYAFDFLKLMHFILDCVDIYYCNFLTKLYEKICWTISDENKHI